ncbi:MAG: hypothetical protein V1926_06335 [Candidatus Peregrinibacteria bacterium]
MFIRSTLISGLLFSALLFAALPAEAASVACPERICHYYDRNGICTNYTCVDSHTDPYVGGSASVSRSRYSYDDNYYYGDDEDWNGDDWNDDEDGYYNDNRSYNYSTLPSYESGVYSRTPNTRCTVSNRSRCTSDIRYRYRRTYDGRYDDYTCRQSSGRCAGLHCQNCTSRPYDRRIDYYDASYDSYYYGTVKNRCYRRTGGTCVR